MPDTPGGEIRLSFYGNLMRYRLKKNDKSRPVAFTPGENLRSIVEGIGVTAAEVNFAQIKGKNITMDYEPNPGDEISLFSLMSGG